MVVLDEWGIEMNENSQNDDVNYQRAIQRTDIEQVSQSERQYQALNHII